jgi:lipid-binding SYLF domain-containing protein
MRLFFFLLRRSELAVSLNRRGLYGNSKEGCRLKRRRYEGNTGNRDCYWEICSAEEFVSQPQFRPSAAEAAMILLHLRHD